MYRKIQIKEMKAFGKRNKTEREVETSLASLSYVYSTFAKKVKSRLDQIQNDFLWGGGSLEWELHLVKWSTVCMEKKNKGPGLKILSNLKKGAWWDEVIAGKYGKEEEGGILVFQGIFGVGLRNVFEEMGTLGEQQVLFCSRE